MKFCVFFFHLLLFTLPLLPMAWDDTTTHTAHCLSTQIGRAIIIIVSECWRFVGSFVSVKLSTKDWTQSLRTNWSFMQLPMCSKILVFFLPLCILFHSPSIIYRNIDNFNGFSVWADGKIVRSFRDRRTFFGTNLYTKRTFLWIWSIDEWMDHCLTLCYIVYILIVSRSRFDAILISCLFTIHDLHETHFLIYGHPSDFIVILQQFNELRL